MSFRVSSEVPFLVGVGRAAMEGFGFDLNPQFRAALSGSLGGYRSHGVPLVELTHSGPIYFTSGETLEAISHPGLERAARILRLFHLIARQAPPADLDSSAP